MAEPTTAEPQSRWRFAEALRPLASRPYRLMWMGSTTSSIGDAVVQIALVFAILHVGGTASDIGVIAAARRSRGSRSCWRAGCGRTGCGGST